MVFVWSIKTNDVMLKGVMGEKKQTFFSQKKNLLFQINSLIVSLRKGNNISSKDYLANEEV
jgi:hypothetical protein